jgi:hypothetical protein
MCPGNCGQPLGGYVFATRCTNAKVSCGQPVQGCIDLLKRLIIESLNLQRDELLMKRGSLVIFGDSP